MTDKPWSLCIHNDSGSNMGWVPAGHTSLSHCIRQKKKKKKNAKNSTSKITLVPLHIWNQFNLGMHMATPLCVFISDQKKGQKQYFGLDKHLE